MKENIFNDKIYYRVNEWKSDRKTLVLVHGLVGSSSAWWEYEKILKEKYNILAFDIRGHGKSKRFTESDDYKIDNFSNDLHELVNYLGIKKFILISHSFGTFIVLDFISKHREFIEAMIFLSPNFNISQMPETKIMRPIINFFSKFKFPLSKTKERIQVDYLRDYPHTGDFDIRRTIADMSNTSLRSYLYCMKQLYSFNGEEILKTINFPTLIIHGKEDKIFPVKYGMMMADKIPNSKIITLDNISHEIKDSLETIGKIEHLMENFIDEVK